LGSWLTEDGKSEKAVKARIALAKGAFWKLKRIIERRREHHNKENTAKLL